MFSFGEILKIRVSFVQAQQVVFEYMEVFYNRIRRHAKIGNQVPADFAYQFYANRQQSAA